MKKNILAAFALTATLIPISAQNADEPKFEISPIGRFHIDGGLFASPDKELFSDGINITDVRLGVKAKYGKWGAKIDIGFNGQKVGMKDIYLEYNFDNNNVLRGGSFVHYFGLEAVYSNSIKPSYIEPLSATTFSPPRLLGLMYVHEAPKWHGQFSAHLEPKASFMTPNELNNEGYGLMARMVLHPFAETGKIFQVGATGSFNTPHTGGESTDPHDFFAFSSNFPTHVIKVPAMNAEVHNSRNMWKFTPEIMGAYRNYSLAAQYYMARVNRNTDLRGYSGWGCYVAARALFFGGDYKYDHANAAIVTPNKRSLEVVAMYSYTDLTDTKAQTITAGVIKDGIFGGRTNEASLTLNYYINKYITARLNYTYTHRWDCATLPDTDLSLVQARIQILF